MGTSKKIETLEQNLSRTLTLPAVTSWTILYFAPLFLVPSTNSCLVHAFAVQKLRRLWCSNLARQIFDDTGVKQPRPQGFSLKKWVGEKPWGRGWVSKWYVFPLPPPPSNSFSLVSSLNSTAVSRKKKTLFETALSCIVNAGGWWVPAHFLMKKKKSKSFAYDSSLTMRNACICRNAVDSPWRGWMP